MLSDTKDFERRIAGADAELRQFFDSSSPVVIARAPGRLDVIGGVADYSGSLVAEATIGEATHVALQKRADDAVRVWSRGAGLDHSAVHVKLSELIGPAAEVGKRLTSGDGRWAAYVLGCYTVLFDAGLIDRNIYGANIAVESSVPLSAGLSSSAALEVATMQAICSAYGLDVEPEMRAALAQRVENEVVGAPCGIMDQMASALGQSDKLLVLLCQPHDVKGYTSLPEGIKVYGIHSNVKHSVAGSPYTRARVAAFMGRRILNDKRRGKGDAALAYLCELTPNKYRRDYGELLPGKMSGQEFLDKVGDHEDPITKVDPDAVYPVRAATEHAIYENNRVKTFLSCLEEADRTAGSQRTMALVRAGMAMYGAHWSYTRIGLGCRETTMLTRLAREAGPCRGVYGAKITGGGSGGVVAVLTSGEDSGQTVHEIACEYEKLTGSHAKIVTAGQSPGAAAFGTVTITL